MMKLALLLGFAVTVIGCMGEETTEPSGSSSSSGTAGGGSSTSTTGGGGAGGAPPIEEHPCAGKAPGVICGGEAKEPIHGECNANEVCSWKEWTCAHGEFGDTCQGGRCAKTATVGENAECCSGCVATSGYCDHSLNQYGGNACK